MALSSELGLDIFHQSLAEAKLTMNALTNHERSRRRGRPLTSENREDDPQPKRPKSPSRSFQREWKELR